MDHDTMIGLIIIAIAVVLFRFSAFIIRIFIFGILVRFMIRCIRGDNRE